MTNTLAQNTAWHASRIDVPTSSRLRCILHRQLRQGLHKDRLVRLLGLGKGTPMHNNTDNPYDRPCSVGTSFAYNLTLNQLEEIVSFLGLHWTIDPNGWNGGLLDDVTVCNLPAHLLLGLLASQLLEHLK